MFSTTQRISLAETDAAGLLYFGAIGPLVHRVYEDFVEKELAYPWQEWFANPRWILPIRHFSVDYLSPLRGGDLITVDLAFKEVRTSSFTLAFSLTKGDLPCALAETVHVFCDQKTLQKIPIPEEIRESFARFQGSLHRKISTKFFTEHVADR